MASILGALGRAAQGALDGLLKGPDESVHRTPGGKNEDSAQNAPMPTEKATQDAKSLFWDPFSVLEQLGYKERPSNITYGTLKAITWKMPIISDVIQTRVNQVASFARPQHNRFEIGFRVAMRNKQDKPTPADRKFIEQAESFITRTGITDNPRGRLDFEGYLRKITWDSLVLDQDVTEIVPNRKGQPAEFYAVDGASIRLADTARMHIDEDLDDVVRYVQIYDGAIINQYTQEELCFGIRNPRTDMRSYGYGVSELELLMNAITSVLYAWEYNSKFFSQGSSAKGLINIKGALPEKQLTAFKRHWYSMVTGIENAWKTPILNTAEGGDVQWLNMQSTNRDMEFNAWMDFLIKVICAGYSMDPSEINFKYGNVGQKSGLSEDSNRDKVVESRERGLRPILRHIEGNLNKHILWPINENFEFEFVGLDAITREEVAKLNMMRVKTYRTIDELRAEDDLAPLPDGKGAIILDPVFVQASAMADQMAAQKAGGFGDPEEQVDEAEETSKERKLVEAQSAENDDDEDEEEDEPRKSVRKSMHRGIRVDLTL